MHYTRTESIYKPPSQEWALLDTLATFQKVKAFRAIADRGDAEEFAEFVHSKQLEAWRDFTPSPLDRLSYDRAEQLARSIWPVDASIIGRVFQWERRRNGLFAIRDLVDAEAGKGAR